MLWLEKKCIFFQILSRSVRVPDSDGAGLSKFVVQQRKSVGFGFSLLLDEVNDSSERQRHNEEEQGSNDGNDCCQGQTS